MKSGKSLENMIENLKIVFKHSKFYIIFLVFVKIIEGLIPVANLWVLNKLINTVSKVIDQPNSNTFNTLYLLIGMQILLMIIPYILNMLSNYLSTKQEMKLELVMETLVFNKIVNVPYHYFDSPDFYNHLQRIKYLQLGKHILSPVNTLLNMIASSISIVSLFIYLLNIDNKIAILALASILPMLFIYLAIGKKQHNLMIKQTLITREANYIKQLIQSKESMKEIRIFSIYNYLYKKWNELFLKKQDETLKLLKKSYPPKIGLEIFNLLTYSIVLILIIRLIKQGIIQVGEFLTIPQAFKNVQSGVNQLSVNLSLLYTQQLKTNDIFTFLNLEEESSDSNTIEHSKFPNPIMNNITFNNVSFSYPGTKKEALKNISISINKNEKIAIVGENGSGKTTLVNCLLRLYIPTKGSILIDGIDIQNFDLNLYRGNVTAIFQDFVKYDFSVQENIGIGDVDRLDNIEQIQKLAMKTGVDNFVKKFEKQYQEQLGRMLKMGEELSGGEWQKIALTRALFRESEIIVLDEPTSAMDARSEYELYENFSELSKNKIVIYISHRLASAKLADKVIVMKNGEIIAVGKHDELLNSSKEYFEMYNTQYHMYA